MSSVARGADLNLLKNESMATLFGWESPPVGGEGPSDTVPACNVGVRIATRLFQLNFGNWPQEVAEGVGFEPTVRLHARRFSRPVP
jgi:hypothetical protein